MRPIQLQTHPFRLLLYLEWILLGITVLTKFPPLPQPPSEVVPRFELLTIFSIIIFGVMGLRLPTANRSAKVLYTGFGFGLILLATVAGGRGAVFFPSLLLIVVIRSCLIFRLTGRLIIAALAFISFSIALFLQFGNITYFLRGSFGAAPGAVITPPLAPIFNAPISEEQIRFIVLTLTFNSSLLFGLVLGFVLLLINALLAERQSRQLLTLANEQLRQYAQRIEDQATLQERNRIAREIHDSLGHSLTAQSIILENALMFWEKNADKAREFLIEARQLGATALKEVRQSVAALRSNPLKGQSLESAIAFLVKNFSQTTGIVPNCTIALSLPLPSEVSTVVYRIIQEALTNISKHGAATSVIIDLQLDARTLYLLVEDNGRGFNPEQNATGFGIQGMRERTAALGGRFKIASTPGNGCRITATIPLPEL